MGPCSSKEGAAATASSSSSSSSSSTAAAPTSGGAKQGRIVKCAPHPDWAEPAAAPAQLVVANSMTGTKTAFVPINKNLVKWYTCGPTVYDSAHLGHARAYVTFDIVRRIMTDYLGYNVFYVMNITDVDDKIILRARKTHLLEAYLKEVGYKEGKVAGGAAQQRALTDRVQAAFKAAVAKLVAKAEQQKTDLVDCQPKQKEALETLLTETSFKQANAQKDSEAVDKLVASLKDTSKPHEATMREIIRVGKDVLCDALDAEKGGDVKDEAIFRRHAAIYEAEFLKDMRDLGVRDADSLTRVTEYIPQIVDFVQGIIKKGYGYASNGSVYFDVTAFQRDRAYGKLAPHSVGNTQLIAEGEGALKSSEKSEKKSPFDFALWKKSKGGEPRWDSPWGQGRPGWHIECSAMGTDMLGDNFDIHSGGEDLRFPHHDNELAQCEAHSGQFQWINYFLHAGHLHIQGLKMSKSLKNFYTIREVLDDFSARQIRLLFLLQAWHAQMQYNDQSLEEAIQKEKTLKEFFLNVEAAQREKLKQAPLNMTDQLWDAADRAMHAALLKTQADVHTALLDNFDYPQTMHLIFQLITDTNKYVHATSKTAGALTYKNVILRQVAEFVDRMMRVYGVIQDQKPGFDAGGAGGAGDEAAAAIDVLAGFRDAVRGAASKAMGRVEDFDAKDLAKDILRMCDDVRDNALPPLGVRLEDKGTGSTWKRDNPEELAKERKAKEAQADAVRLKKLESKLAALEKDEKRWQAARVDPKFMFQTAEAKQQYSAWDETGMPTSDAAGKPLAKSALKKAKKEHEKQTKARQQYDDKVKAEPKFYEMLQSEIGQLRDQLGKAQ